MAETDTKDAPKPHGFQKGHGYGVRYPLQRRRPDLQQALEKKLLEEWPEHPGQTREDWFANLMIALAHRGHAKAIEIIWDRIHGKVPLPVGIIDTTAPPHSATDIRIEIVQVAATGPPTQALAEPKKEVPAPMPVVAVVPSGNGSGGKNGDGS